MRSKLLFSVTTVLCMGMLVSVSANATPAVPGVSLYEVSPWFAVDVGRSIEGIIEGIINLCSDGDAKAELIVTQEATNANADGTAGDSANTATTAAAAAATTGKVEGTAFSNGVYDYIHDNVLNQTDLARYSVLKTDLASPKAEGNARATCESLHYTEDRPKNTCIAVVDTFFADKGAEGNTEEYKSQKKRQRQEYAEEVTKYHTKLGYTVQEKVIADLKKASQAPIATDNEVSSIAIDGQTLDEMIKITVADLALQIEMMEADAVAFLMQQPVEILPEQRPAVGGTDDTTDDSTDDTTGGTSGETTGGTTDGSTGGTNGNE